jgi:LVIVD repeat-containing protein
MNYRIVKIMVAAVFAATVSGQANARTHSRSIVVESPSDLPEIAQRKSEAMYIRETGGGQTILYLEQDNGRSLAILDISDLGAIRPVGEVSIAARSPYDFVETVNDSAALIHYRDRSGFALINFKKFKKPVLTEAPQFEHPAGAEALGHTGLMLTSMNHPITQAPDPKYEIFDVSNPSHPTVLATIDGVTERMERPETGTVFMLNNDGLTVIRRPNVEQEYEIETTYVN